MLPNIKNNNVYSSKVLIYARGKGTIVTQQSVLKETKC